MASQGPSKTYWPTLGNAFLFWVVSAILFASATRYLSWGHSTVSSIPAVLGAIVGTVLSTLLFVRWRGTALKETGMLPGQKTLSRLSTGILVGILLGSMQTIPVLLTGHLRIMVNDHISAGAITATIFLYVLLACREELVFRGYILRSLNSTGRAALAVVVTTGLFFIEHSMGGMSWQASIWGSGTGSVLFCIAALKTRGLAFPIGVHAAWNVTQWTLGFKNSQSPFLAVIDKGSETSLELIGMISFLAVMWLAIIILLSPFKKIRVSK